MTQSIAELPLIDFGCSENQQSQGAGLIVRVRVGELENSGAGAWVGGFAVVGS
jgi:hypothetical protein